MAKYYGVRNGRKPGVYRSWEECKAQTSRFPNAQFKCFNTEGEAQQYVYGSVGHQSSNYPYVSSRRLQIFTDGACTKNGFSDAKGGIGVHFPDRPDLDISERLFGRQTSNRAEIEAASRALEIARANRYTEVDIYTDSEFLYRAMTEWLEDWMRNNWMKRDGTVVVNKEDFQRLLRAAQGMDIIWNTVRAHTGVPGNEEADRRAKEGVDNRFNKYY